MLGYIPPGHHYPLYPCHFCCVEPCCCAPCHGPIVVETTEYYPRPTPRGEGSPDRQLSHREECPKCKREDRGDKRVHTTDEVDSEHPYYQPRENLIRYNRYVIPSHQNPYSKFSEFCLVDFTIGTKTCLAKVVKRANRPNLRKKTEKRDLLRRRNVMCASRKKNLKKPALLKRPPKVSGRKENLKVLAAVRSTTVTTNRKPMGIEKTGRGKSVANIAAILLIEINLKIGIEVAAVISNKNIMNTEIVKINLEATNLMKVSEETTAMKTATGATSAAEVITKKPGITTITETTLHVKAT